MAESRLSVAVVERFGAVRAYSFIHGGARKNKDLGDELRARTMLGGEQSVESRKVEGTISINSALES